MKKMKIALLIYSQFLLLLLFLAVLLAGQLTAVLVPFFLLTPVLFYLSAAIVSHMFKAQPANLPAAHFVLSRLLRTYSTVVSILLLASTLFLMKSAGEFFLVLLILPLPAYFLSEIYASSGGRSPTSVRKSSSPLDGEILTEEQYKKRRKAKLTKELARESDGEVLRGVSDIDRRQFLKLLGGGSIGMVAMLMLNPHKASAAFFGSVPGPGTVSVKNSSGTVIDPKEKAPTDGYTVSEVDDVGSPSYYGFTNKDGAWYISKEGSDGSYRYFKGASNFSTNWTNRASLAYDYFDNIF